MPEVGPADITAVVTEDADHVAPSVAAGRGHTSRKLVVATLAIVIGGLLAIVVTWAVRGYQARSWKIADSFQAVCGDAEHCLVAGSATSHDFVPVGPGQDPMAVAPQIAGAIATTADGGKTWHAVRSAGLPEDAIDGVGDDSFYCHGDTCWAAWGSANVLAVRIDRHGAPHPTVHDLRPYFWSYPGDWLHASCVSSTRCVDLTSPNDTPGDFTVLRTTDSGKHWSYQKYPLPSGVVDPVTGPAWCSAQSRCLAAVADYPCSAHCYPTALLHSDDGGQTWSPIKSPLPGQMSVWCDGTSTCTATPYPLEPRATQFAISTDQGEHWSRPISAGPHVTSRVLCSSAHLCIAPGARHPRSSGPSAIWQSSDGGHSWHSPYRLPSGSILGSLGCSTGARCLASIDGPGRVVRVAMTSPGGKWTLSTMPRPVRIKVDESRP